MLIATQWVIGSPRSEQHPFSFHEWLYSRPVGDRELGVILEDFWAWWVPLALIFSLILMVAVVYIVRRLNQIRAEQQSHLKKLTLESAQGNSNKANERWSHILQLSESGNENDWRQAIMEADIILDSMMSAMGYTQDTLGEKLKSVEKSDFTSIDEAWEAHKVRNAIAHKGSDLDISHREVHRVIELYKKVFEEFHYI